MNPELEDQQDTAADDETGFDDGFSASAPTETPGQAQQANNQDDDAAPAPAAPKYVQLTEQEVSELKARAAAIDEIKATHDKSFGTAFGKIGGIERQLADLRGGKRVDISEAEIQELRDDGWEPLANALEKVRNLSVIPGAGFDEAKAGELFAQVAQSRMAEQAQKYELRFLAMQHPDWQQVDRDPAFAAWVASQPADFQQGLVKASAEYDSDTVAKAMSAFKATRKPQQEPQRQSRFEAAATPRGTRAAPSANPEDEFDAGFNSR